MWETEKQMKAADDAGVFDDNPYDNPPCHNGDWLPRSHFV